MLYQINIPLTTHPVVRLYVRPVARRYPYPPLAEKVALYIYAPALVYNP